MAALVAGGLGFALADGLSASVEPTPVELVAVDDVGTDPFTVSVSTVTVDDVIQVTGREPPKAPPGDGSGRSSTESKPGPGPRTVDPSEVVAYGDRTSAPLCDIAALEAALDADRGARQAWADLMEVDPNDVGALLATLTPLVLARDTAVTNTRYVDGEPAAFQAVLQSGTAVLVDDRGRPRVKCDCGNPLLAPDQTDGATYRGDPWERFDEESVVTIDGVDPGTDRSAVSIPTIDLDSGEVGTTDLGGVDDPEDPTEDPVDDPVDTPATEPSVPAPATPAPPPDDYDDAIFEAACAGNCTAVASADLDHPKYGPGRIAIYTAPGDFMDDVVGYYFTSTATGSIVFGRDLGIESIVPSPGASDDLGHLHVGLSPGTAYDAPLVVVPTSDGFSTLGTEEYWFGPTSYLPFGSSHYLPTYGDVDGDGVLEIYNTMQECSDPDCSTFVWRQRIWKWNGSTFTIHRDWFEIDPP